MEDCVGHAVAPYPLFNLNSTFRKCVVQTTDEFETVRPVTMVGKQQPKVAAASIQEIGLLLEPVRPTNSPPLSTIKPTTISSAFIISLPQRFF